jgi:luciferase family oxidoreductase group 1
MDTLTSPAPEILIARVAAETTSIRVGSGGILLPHYSPMKVAEVFRMLHALYPRRIDLGIGRAPGGTQLESYALQRDRRQRLQAEDFVEQIEELRHFFDDDFPPKHPFARISLSPKMPGKPEIWMLGSSMWSAEAAAKLGLPYAFAHFINQQPTRQAIEHYRRNFTPSRDLAAPRAIVATGALCAESSEEANRLISSARLLGRRIRQGILGPIATPADALRELGTKPDLEARQFTEWPRYFVGTPDMVREQLNQMAAELRIEEIMIVTIVHDHAARCRSYELLAASMGLVSQNNAP